MKHLSIDYIVFFFFGGGGGEFSIKGGIVEKIQYFSTIKSIFVNPSDPEISTRK